MKHSRILSLIMALSFGMTLSACGKTDKASQSNSSDISVQTAPSSEQSSGSSNILIAFFFVPEDIDLCCRESGSCCLTALSWRYASRIWQSGRLDNDLLFAHFLSSRLEFDIIQFRFALYALIIKTRWGKFKKKNWERLHRFQNFASFLCWIQLFSIEFSLIYDIFRL